jgi:uncharacterized protein (TIGR03085 family)
MSVARDERNALCDLLVEIGPDKPTLCAGWQTRDLAAHLVVREHRPGAALGILVKPLARSLQRVQDSYAAKPWPELVERIRSGPAAYWPTAIPAVDRLVNTSEFFVHHEDVRRAQPGWEPRPSDARRDAALWSALTRMGWMLFRRSPVGVVVRSDDGSDKGREAALKRGPNTVTISGAPGEMLLFAFGRDQAKVDFDGEQSSIGAVRGLRRGL